MPLHKSNSEHGVVFKHRTPLQRSRSDATNAQSNSRLAPVSEKTKSKLNRFQYHATDNEPSATADGLNKITTSGGLGNTLEGENFASPHHTSPSLGLSKDDSSITPKTKLWSHFEPGELADDDTSTSPNETVVWDSKYDANSAGISPMVHKRRRKRARSSSPTSSPGQLKPNTPALDLRKRPLRSPQVDPSFELTPNGFMNPALNLAQLMVSSSPRQFKNGPASRPESVLRRVISCGGAKRRKVERQDTSAVLSGSIPDQLDTSKSSLMTALLEGIHDTSPSQGLEILAESPSPRKRYATISSSESPSRPRLVGRGIGEEANQSLYAEDEDSMGLNSGKGPDPPQSDYGDDDFDDDTFMELEAAIVPVQSEEASQNHNFSAQPISEKPPLEEEGSYSDDDLDDDIFAAAEGMINSVEANPGSCMQPTSQKVPPQPSPGIRHMPAQEVDDAFGDAFGDDFGDGFDFDAAEMAATQSVKQSKTSVIVKDQKPRAIQRYLVTEVIRSEYIDHWNNPQPEQILLVQTDGTKNMKVVHTRGIWCEIDVQPKSFVHIIGAFSPQGQCIIDDSQNMLILHPDQLISSTVVADSFTCARRAVLQDRVKATTASSPPLVYGTMLHEIFQEALLENQWDLKFLSTVIDKVTSKHVEDLYTIKVAINVAREHLQSKMRELSSWADAFVTSQPNPGAFVSERGSSGKPVATMCVPKLLDVEEHVWSPMYGLKGNIDATVQVIMRDGSSTRTLTVPFEVKTGKTQNHSHQAQTALYNLLLSDRYDIEIAYGILYYMETSEVLRIKADLRDLRHMVMQRNRLACFIRERSVKLPEMKRSKGACGKCYAKVSCFIYHKLADDGDGETSGMGKAFDQVVQHLTPKHKEFFLKWEDLLTKEEKQTQKQKRELWTMVSADREKVGRCFSDVIIEEGSWSEDLDNPKINRFRYTFIKRNSVPGFSFLESQLAVGEPVVVSDEQGHFALSLGYVTKVRKDRISVAVDRRLHNARIRQPGFDETNNQVFAGIMEVSPEGCTPEQSQGRIKEEPVRYRLDKDEFSNGMAVVRNNLVQVMADGVFGSREIRRLVVDLIPPRFKAVATQYVVAERETLNVDQQKAIEKVMSAQDYALVLGMPGTGKTTTIAHIIRALVAQGKSVLLTSYTHTAVDNILLKLKNDKTPILRLGAPAKVHPDVQEFVTLAGLPMTSFDQIKEAWHDSPIVATTCLGIGHPIFNERTFDYCIVDEASQITLPICMGPIRMAHTFVLVGDHNQLPPLVQNEEARHGGLDISLFKLLSDTHPEAVVNLEHQYRMCEDIMTLSNTLIYEGRLRCGTEALRFSKLDVPHMNALTRRHHNAASMSLPGTPRSICTGLSQSRCWLRDLIDSEARVRFVNTDTLEPRVYEVDKGNRIVNPAEASIVVQLVDSLLTVGVPESEIGVMTHYRSQLSLLKHGLRGNPGVEMHTADRFQGRDKEVVVLSLVRSNEGCKIGELLKDWRRINVAFTRAKTKLLVVGSRNTLKGSGSEEMLSRFISLMEERDWIYDLPADALESHFFDDVATQLTAPLLKSSSPKKKMADKENRRPEPKRVMIGERALLKDKVLLRDIINEMTNGAY